MSKPTKARRDLHQEVTDKILALMESGQLPWEKPWKRGQNRADGLLPYNAVSRNNYSGINLALLWATSGDYTNNQWVTFKQAIDLGGNVKKGEKGTGIVFFKPWKVEDKKTGEDKYIPLLKPYTVFNIDQCEGLTLPDLKPVEPPEDPRGAVLEIANANSVNLEHGGDRACFIPSRDRVQMPHFQNFKSEQHYSATLAHELTHWTGHKDRLNRDLSGMFGCEKYAKEELIAEMGSAFLMAELGLEYEARHHAAYLQSWIKGLKEDKKFIFQAAAAASKATALLQGRSKTEEKPEEEKAA